ncbi:DsbA family oxidoreductase [Fictibacillus terranigra]|uniref:DsbA family oxidoreductase n=1 Tax=Fictibacillus terranigra TaxID=3058424 RepID=A0ABT8E3G9_9BACL|nr:DsbA family oxidoreductase [Fictibacillus sp. CENA-BCM004]MDN4072452.1 DsbA family oxidoreductase [Fictibacillus sp. CENA-BCM004]
MKVEIWSDYVCPFCYIGKRRFENALNEFEGRENVEVIYKSFELDPSFKNETNKNMHTVLSEKYGMSYEQAKGMNDQMTQRAREVGLAYDFENMKPANTFDAHRVSHFAKQTGRLKEVTERILKGYFTEGHDISDHETLATLAAEAGLDREETLAVLSEGKFADDVRKDEAEASQLKITGVPFFVFNQKYGVSGAQPEGVFTEVLEKVREEEQNNSAIQLLNDNGKKKYQDDQCADGSCRI